MSFEEGWSGVLYGLDWIMGFFWGAAGGGTLQRGSVVFVMSYREDVPSTRLSTADADPTARPHVSTVESLTPSLMPVLLESVPEHSSRCSKGVCGGGGGSHTWGGASA